MPKNVLRGLSVVLGVLFLYGCSATKNVEVRSYIEVKDRIDQNMEGGNAGYVFGAPQPEDRSDIRKTRKIYVVEVSKGIDEEEEIIVESSDVVVEKPAYEEDAMEDDSRGQTGEEYKVDTSYRGGMDTTYYEEDVSRTIKTPSSFVEYTVQKDDTLQKISKKFYDSYSKWQKIYEANKGVIDNPDRIKPGIVLQIPME